MTSATMTVDGVHQQHVVVDLDIFVARRHRRELLHEGRRQRVIDDRRRQRLAHDPELPGLARGQAAIALLGEARRAAAGPELRAVVGVDGGAVAVGHDHPHRLGHDDRLAGRAMAAPMALVLVFILVRPGRGRETGTERRYEDDESDAHGGPPSAPEETHGAPDGSLRQEAVAASRRVRPGFPWRRAFPCAGASADGRTAARTGWRRRWRPACRR